MTDDADEFQRQLTLIEAEMAKKEKEMEALVELSREADLACRASLAPTLPLGFSIRPSIIMTPGTDISNRPLTSSEEVQEAVHKRLHHNTSETRRTVTTNGERSGQVTAPASTPRSISVLTATETQPTNMRTATNESLVNLATISTSGIMDSIRASTTHLNKDEIASVGQHVGVVSSVVTHLVTRLAAAEQRASLAEHRYLRAPMRSTYFSWRPIRSRRTYSRAMKLGFVLASAVVLLLCGIVCAIFFGSWVRMFIDHELVLRQGSMTFEWWAHPPVRPFVKVYVYNVTNADEFLNNGSKPILDELGPYVYSEEWEKVNITDNENGTLSFNYKRTYTFQPELSRGYDDDAVVVPNIPMLSATSQSKNAARFLRLAMASIMDILKIKPFVEVSVGQLLWGYEDPLLKLAKDVVPKDHNLPYKEFGLFYGKNDTSNDVVTMYTGATSMSEYGIINRYNMKDKLQHWTTDQCNSLAGSDGSIFPPHITKNDTLAVYDKDLCRLLPLKFLEEVQSAGIEGYRFTPPEDVFANNEHNRCFCPSGSPCAPEGLFNVSLCQYDSPIMLSFPHFYLADPSLRERVEGISPPVPEDHRLFIDIQPEMGIAMRARARIQINLAVSQVVDIKQVANFPDIIFPILWFEEGIDELPEQVTSLLRLATKVPPIARTVLGWGLSALGILLILLAVTCLIRSSHRQSTLRLEGHVVAKPPPSKTPSKENGYELNSRR